MIIWDSGIKNKSYLLILVVILLTVCRILFFLFNKQHFPSFDLGDAFFYILIGIRFDLSTIIYFNIPFILTLTFERFFSNYHTLIFKLSNAYFITINMLVLFINLVDIAYFPFALQRSSYQTILLLGDSIKSLPIFIVKFWYIIFFGIVFWLILYYTLKKNHKILHCKALRGTTSKFWIQSIIFYCLIFIIARGLNTYPLTPGSANLYVKVPFTPLVNNSAFNILVSLLNRTENTEPHFSDIDKSHVEHAGLYRVQGNSALMNKKNIIVFILESFSKSYLDTRSPYKADTPFLDSIIRKSIVCTNAYSNGRMSINGLNSVIGSIPPIAFQTIINSPYQNKIKSGIGSLLESDGYSTHFFYGSNDDHYGFKRLVRQYGISNYYSENDFGNNKFHDGAWGIYDMQFLEYAQNTLSKQSTPFFAAIFNISSHYPFKVPEPYNTKLKKGPLNSSKSISYVDKSLEAFFLQAAKKDWFRNTIFAFVADHPSYGDNSDKSRTAGINKFAIPLFFYSPDETVKAGKYDGITDQLDVIPTLMDLIHFPQEFISFGKSIFDSTNKNTFSCSVLEYPYVLQLTNDSLTLQFNLQKEESIGLYKYKTDHNLDTNLVNNKLFTAEKEIMGKTLKQHLFEYYYRLNQAY